MTNPTKTKPKPAVQGPETHSAINNTAKHIFDCCRDTEVRTLYEFKAGGGHRREDGAEYLDSCCRCGNIVVVWTDPAPETA